MRVPRGCYLAGWLVYIVVCSLGPSPSRAVSPSGTGVVGLAMRRAKARHLSTISAYLGSDRLCLVWTISAYLGSDRLCLVRTTRRKTCPLYVSFICSCGSLALLIKAWCRLEQHHFSLWTILAHSHGCVIVCVTVNNCFPRKSCYMFQSLPMCKEIH